jgi:uncharacterized membrane protein
MKGPTPEHILSTNRLEALADGIFSIVMTLLVLDIKLPERINLASADQAILQYLIDIMARLGIYAIVFLLLGTFWYGHHRIFNFIEYCDTGLIWINLIFFMFISLTPFTTNLAGSYGHFQMAVLPMEIHILIIVLIFNYMWFYIISRPKILSEKLNSSEIAINREIHIIQTVLSLTAILISFFSPIWSTLPYILMIYLSISTRYRLIK